MSFPSTKQVAFTTPSPESYAAQRARQRAHDEAQAKRAEAFKAMQAALNDLAMEASWVAPSVPDGQRVELMESVKRARAALASASATITT